MEGKAQSNDHSHVYHDRRNHGKTNDGRSPVPNEYEPPTVRAHNLCGMDPLVAVPHTTMCIEVDSFTEENRSPLHVRALISLLDVTVCKVTPVILHGVVSPET